MFRSFTQIMTSEKLLYITSLLVLMPVFKETEALIKWKYSESKI